MSAGSRVLKGNFFSPENLLDMTHLLEEIKVTTVDVKSVRYICCCICFEIEGHKEEGKEKNI